MSFREDLSAERDTIEAMLAWLSPIGWAQAMRPYADERWWPLALSLVTAGLLVAVAVALRDRRDEAAGVVQPRPGPARARRALGHPLGLALRLQRGALVGWSAGMLVSGVSIGLTGRDAERLVGDSSELSRLLAHAGGSVSDQYFAVSMLSMALIGAGFGIQSALRLRSEETSGRLEPLLATACSRTAWAGAYVVVALLGSVVVLAANGLGAGVADAISGDDVSLLLPLLAAGVVPAPAVWVLVGIAVALFGLAPRAATGAWAALGACVLLTLLGPLLNLPDWVLDGSPFAHVPALPAVAFRAGPPLTLTAIAAALVAVGLAAFRRRDLAS